jgi:hypothetical protein
MATFRLYLHNQKWQIKNVQIMMMALCLLEKYFLNCLWWSDSEEFMKMIQIRMNLILDVCQASNYPPLPQPPAITFINFALKIFSHIFVKLLTHLKSHQHIPANIRKSRFEISQLRKLFASSQSSNVRAETKFGNLNLKLNQILIKFICLHFLV